MIKPLLRTLFRALFRLLYRVEIHGEAHYRDAGKRTLIVANHTSFLDAALIAAFLPDTVTFAINTHMERAWWLQPFLALVEALPLDPTNPLAVKSLITRLREDQPCMIFPEGRITVTGSLMKIYEGPGMIADKAGAALLPIRIDGAQYSPFSRLKGKVRIRWFPKIDITFLPPQHFHVDDALKGRKRRQAAGAKLYDVMTQMMFESSQTRLSLMEALINAAHVHGRGHRIAEDIERKPIGYGSFLTRAYTLGRHLARRFPGDTTFGLLLPSAVSASVAFFALQAEGKVAAMLNFTAGGAAMGNACKAAEVKIVLTSRRFIEKGKLETAMNELQATGIQLVYLEDEAKAITLGDKLMGLACSYAPSLHPVCISDPDKQAVILFTSGSEGTPKGVALSHASINANTAQLAARVDFGPQDIVFNALPMFHAFGLTAGTLLPILSGIRTFYYPSPLHYRIVPELVYDTNATILFGTDTFLAGYARFAHPYDFHSLRYIFSGAEKLKEETRKIYAEKFGVRIFEGYGATEAAPVISTNTPMQNRAGTVGRFMPSIAWKLEAAEGIEEGGRLWIKGPNLMLGYLRAENPGVLETLADGWYDTGDIVTVDELGFITIRGRLKRFAKIAGEMVSLASVEDAAGTLWPEHRHAAVSLPDPKKGEQIVLVTDREDATREALSAHFKSSRLPEIAAPRQIVAVARLPMLGTGKTDYGQVKKLAEGNMKDGSL